MSRTKTLKRELCFRHGSLFLQKENTFLYEQKNDILYQAAIVWKELTKYQYAITYGYRKQLHTLYLTFSNKDFSHLAGFQYLKDISFPKYNPSKIIDQIINGKITYSQIQKGCQFNQSVKPRLTALIHLKDILETDFTLFSFIPHLYPFSTTMKADYLISSHRDFNSFIFILHVPADETQNCNYLCYSAFIKEIRNYETNQRPRTILRKEKVHIETGTVCLLYDKLTIPPHTHHSIKSADQRLRFPPSFLTGQSDFPGK